MAYIPMGQDNNFLPVILQLIEQSNRHRSDQAQHLIDAQRGGATVAESGLTPKQQKAYYGQVRPGTSVVKPEMAQDRSTKMMLAKIDTMKPEEVDMFTSSLLSRELGVPQVTTGKGLVAQAGTSEAQSQAGQEAASARLRWVKEGIKSIDTTAPVVEGGKKPSTMVGENLVAGATTEDLGAKNLESRVGSETRRVALKILADPNHPLNKVMDKELGYNAISAAGGVALGLTSLLDTTARLAWERDYSGKAASLEMLKASLDMDKDLNRAEAGWAQEVAKNFGGSVTPRAILNWKRWREGGGDPKKMPTGISSELDEVLSAGTAIAQRAFITEQAEKGDPQAKTILQIAQGMQKITNNNQLAAFTDLLRMYYGQVQANAALGPRPDPTKDPSGAAKWDATAKAVQSKLPRVDPKWWFTGGGVELQGPPPAGGVDRRAIPGVGPLPPGQGAVGPTQPTISLPGGQSLPAPGLNEKDIANIQLLLKALPGLNQVGASQVKP